MCSAWRSASEYTATEAMPSSSSARITRTAISPRLATRTLENIAARDGIPARRQPARMLRLALAAALLAGPARAAQDPFTGVEQDRFAAGDSPADRIAGPWSG